jgi:hypothetical protein
MMIQKHRTYIFLLALTGLLSVTVHARQSAEPDTATNVRIPQQAELEDIISRSSLIVRGQVSKTESYWRSDEHGRHIYTRVTIEPILQTVKSQVEGPLVFEVIGGTINEVAEMVSGVPKFNSKEDVILFLTGSPYSLTQSPGWLAPGYFNKMNVYDNKIYWDGTQIRSEAFMEIIELITEGLSPYSIWEQETQKFKLSSTTDVPVITSISPDKASAGTNTQVTITGSNFGTAQGTGKLEFFYQQGKSKISADIVSWNDTRIVCTVPAKEVDGYSASAGSGPVTVTTGGGTSEGKLFRVTFGYSRLKWAGTNPNVPYYINENTSDCTGEGSAVQRAMNTWETGSEGGFNFVYAGTHTNTSPDLNNGKNEIMWGSAGGLATTYYKYNPSTGNILECDIAFNDSYNWTTSNSPAYNQFDVESAALHELGHWQGLLDLYGNANDNEYDKNKAMYGIAYGGAIKRSLHTDDIDGIRWIYPSSTPPPPPPPAYVDIGLRVYDGTEIISIACEPQGTLTSPLRIARNGVIYGIVLVPTDDPSATGIKINTSSGIKAIRKY